MLLRYIILSSLVFWSSIVIGARDYKYGKVELAELSQKSHPNDAEAHAAYIYKNARVSFDFTNNGIFLITEHEQRIKIYDDQGEGYGDYAVFLYRDGGIKQKISGIKGGTYNLENGKAVKSKLEKDAIFKDEASENYTKYSWAMPDVKAGSIIEIKYRTRSPWYYTIPRFDFQTEIPVDLANYSVQMPQTMTYTPVSTGFVQLDFNKSERKGDTGMENVYEFKASDVKALEDDEFVLDIDDYRSSLKYDLYTTTFYGLRSYSTSWNEIARDLMNSKYFGSALKKKTKNLKFLIKETSAMTEDEKIAHIYEYVRSNFNWNDELGIFRDEGIKKLLKMKTGNVGDINLLLVNLLRQAGVDAMPYATKVRSHGMLNTINASRSELNYLLAYVKKEDSYILLDATSKYAPVGQLPTRAVNLKGIVIKEKSAEVIDITNPNKAIYQAVCDYTIDMETPSLIGVGKSKKKDYAATLYRLDKDYSDEEEDTDEDDDAEEDEDAEEDIIIENELEYTSIEGLEDLSSDISFEYTENIYNEISVIGDQIFIDAMLDFGRDENPFFEESREMPVFFSSLPKVNYVMSIAIPEGYKLESTPEPVKLSLEGRKMSFGYKVTEMNGKLNIYYSFSAAVDVFEPIEYKGIKQIYDSMVEKSKEKIVLSKI